jgi:hypothetical protein
MPALALKDEYEEEVPVSASDETGVALLRDDIKELKSDLRAMAVKVASDLKEIWDRIDRQLAYLREDMREMRADTKLLREKLESSYVALSKKNDDTQEKLDKRVDGVQQTVSQKIEGVENKLDKKIDLNHVSVCDRIDGLTNEVRQLNSKLDRFGGSFGAFRWIFTAIAALASVIAAIASAGSAFHIF